MGSDLRLTLPLLAVLRVMTEAPLEHRYGLDIARTADLPLGTIYPVLARLEGAGWVAREWEQIDEAAEGRRRRCYYTLTGIGAYKAHAALQRQSRVIGTALPRPGTAPA